MLVHELDCCPMHVRLRGNPFQRTDAQYMPARCLLLELDDRLVLVDTGVGVDEVAHWRGQLSAVWVALSRPKLDPAVTAFEQVRALGHDPRDVRDIVFTHLDTDHAGGLPDFPHATAHVLERERDASLARRRIPGLQQGRYRRDLLAAHEHWLTYGAGPSDRWFGIDGSHRVTGIDADVCLVPLPGHSVGHAGVAIDTGDGWLLHAGDTIMDLRQVTDPSFRHAPGLVLFELGITANRAAAQRSIQQLRELHARGECRIICSHDPGELVGGADDHSGAEG